MLRGRCGLRGMSAKIAYLRNMRAAITFILSLYCLSSTGQSHWQEYNGNDTVIDAIVATTAMELCDSSPYSMADTEPTCNGKAWQVALAEATATDAMPDEALRLVVKSQVNCKGNMGNISLGESAERMTPAAIELLMRLTSASGTLTCTPATVKGKPVDFEASKAFRFRDGKLTPLY